MKSKKIESKLLFALGYLSMPVLLILCFGIFYELIKFKEVMYSNTLLTLWVMVICVFSIMSLGDKNQSFMRGLGKLFNIPN